MTTIVALETAQVVDAAFEVGAFGLEALHTSPRVPLCLLDDGLGLDFAFVDQAIASFLAGLNVLVVQFLGHGEHGRSRRGVRVGGGLQQRLGRRLRGLRTGHGRRYRHLCGCGRYCAIRWGLRQALLEFVTLGAECGNGVCHLIKKIVNLVLVETLAVLRLREGFV